MARTWAFENAEKPFQEAQLLGSSGAFARALTMHQISMEECLRQGSNHLGVLNKVLKDPDAIAMQAKDLLGRLEKLKTIARELDEEFQEIVDAWLDEQAGKAREVAGGS